ncbi:putative Amidohydrolase [Seiridium cardinale]|uniref:Amidohydrolase n=1 Tax=Seiridium cardinale TaxID=138064 RepID=A0ABR2XWW8_9PEZI
MRLHHHYHERFDPGDGKSILDAILVIDGRLIAWWEYISVRGLSGLGCEIPGAVEDGTVVGPIIYSSGGGLSQTGGHGDIHDLPARMVLGNIGVTSITPDHFGTGALMAVDGKEECRRAVRLDISPRGTVHQGGGLWRCRVSQCWHFCPQFSSEEQERVFEEAARQTLAIAAHVHAKPGIMAVIRAGVVTVEHGSFGDREAMDLIRKKGVVCSHFNNHRLLNIDWRERAGAASPGEDQVGS